MKRILLSTVAAAAMTLATAAAAQDYPSKDLQGIIQWGAGGSTDTVMRAVTPHVEEALGEDIVLVNRTGGVGSIAVKFVQNADPDGYTLLMGAENPQIYKVMGLADVDYGDFYPVSILARGVPIIVAAPDAPYDTIGEMVEYARANPGEIRAGSTGPGGLASVVGAMLASQGELPVTNVPYDGDGPALTALQGGAIDVMSVVYGAAIDGIEAGRMKALGVIDSEPLDALEGVPAVVETFPELERFLPWGPFFGVFVANDTPDDIKEKLVAAFKAGAEAEEFQQLMADRGFRMMNIADNNARMFLESFQETSSWILYDTGAAKVSPAEFGIPRS